MKGAFAVVYLFLAAVVLSIGAVYWFIQNENTEIQKFTDMAKDLSGSISLMSVQIQNMQKAESEASVKTDALLSSVQAASDQLIKAVADQKTDIDLLKQRVKDLESKPKQKELLPIKLIGPVEIEVIKAKPKATPLLDRAGITKRKPKK